MTRVRREVQFSFRPGTMQVPCARHRTDYIVAPLDNHAGDLANLADDLDQIILSREETVVHEVVTLDAREGFSKVWIGKSFDRFGIEIELRSRSFPNRPCARGCDANLVVVAGESTIVSAHHILAFIFRDDLDEFFPDIGKDPTAAFLIEPLDLFRPAEKDSAQH